jgi:microcystin-dependent protein
MSAVTKPHSTSLIFQRLLMAVLITAAALVAAPGAHAAQTQPLGLPSGDSLLFVMQADSGSMAHVSGARYTLTLRSTAQHTIYFADRPARDSGRVSTRTLIRNWKGLGFVADPPNAVLSTSGTGPDDVVIELGQPRSRENGRTLQIPVQVLGRRHLGLRKKFGSVSLFIDDATVNDGCGYTGQVDVYPNSVTPDQFEYLRPGSTVPIAGYPELYKVIGHRFGGDDTYFKLPDAGAPDGMHALICANGNEPSSQATYVDGAAPAACALGQVQLFSQEETVWGYLSASGQTVNIGEHPRLFDFVGTTFGGDGTSTFALPNLPALPGMSWQICAFGDPTVATSCIMTRIDYWAQGRQTPGIVARTPESFFPGNTPYATTSGQLMSVQQNTALFGLLSTDFGGNGKSTFSLPGVDDPATMVHAHICMAGRYPVEPPRPQGAWD